MVSLRSATACVLVAVVAGSAARATTYEEALHAYWREDNVAAAHMMCDLVVGSTNDSERQRASYLLGILVDGKMKTNELTVLRSELAAAGSPFENYVAGNEALRQGAKPEAFTRLAGFAVKAPRDDLRLLGLRALCGYRWQRMEIGGDRFLLLGLLETAQRLDFRECPESFLAMTQTLGELARGEKDTALEGRVARFQFKSQPTQAAAFTAARALLRAGLDKEATDFVDEVFKTLPESQWPDVYTQMAMAYRDAGRPDGAIAMLQRGVEAVGSNNCSMGMALARECESQGRIRDALDALERIASVCSQARSRLDQLRATTPEKYVRAWKRGLEDRVRELAVEAGYGVCALSINGGWATLARLGENGDSFNRIRLQDEIKWKEERVRFAVLPDGSFLVGEQVFDPDSLAVAPKTPLPPPDEALGRAAASVQATVFAMARCGQQLVVAKDDGLVVFDAAGNLLREVRCPTNAPHSLSRIRDLATDEDGLIYVAQWDEQGIYVLDSEFRFLTKIPGLTTRLAVDRKGDVYRMTFGDIEKFEPRDGGARAMVKKP